MPLAEKIIRPITYALATTALIAMLGSALAVTKKAYPPQKAKLELEGWNLKLTTKMPLQVVSINFSDGDNGLKVAIEGATDTSAGRSSTARPYYYPRFEDLVNIAEKGQDSTGSEKFNADAVLYIDSAVSTIHIPLSLSFQNEIQVSISTPSESGFIGHTQEDTVMSVGNVCRVKKGGVTFLLEKEEFREGALALLPTLAELNSLIPKKDRIRFVVIRNARAGGRKAVVDRYSAKMVCSSILVLYSRKIRDDEPVIFLSSGLLQDQDLAKLSVFHEGSHAYFNSRQLLSLEMPVLLSYYEYIMSWYPGKDNPVMWFFDEGNYSSHAPPDSVFDIGHPYDSISELFASTCTILRFYPAEFFSRLASYESYDPNAVAISRVIAECVVSTFGKHKVFPEEVYSELGIK